MINNNNIQYFSIFDLLFIYYKLFTNLINSRLLLINTKYNK